MFIHLWRTKRWWKSSCCSTTHSTNNQVFRHGNQIKVVWNGELMNERKGRKKKASSSDVCLKGKNQGENVDWHTSAEKIVTQTTNKHKFVYSNQIDTRSLHGIVDLWFAWLIIEMSVKKPEHVKRMRKCFRRPCTGKQRLKFYLTRFIRRQMTEEKKGFQKVSSSSYLRH